MSLPEHPLFLGHAEICEKGIHLFLPLVAYRSGYAAGRRSIDEYVFGCLKPSLLAPLGHFDHACVHCDALLFAAESGRASKDTHDRSGSFCCRKGLLKNLPVLPPAPSTLASLLSGYQAHDVPLDWHPFTSAGVISTYALTGAQKARSNDFKQHIRRYNSALGFASFSDALSTADSNTLGGNGPPVYILHGRAYHIAGTLYPLATEKPKYAQLYVLDPDASVDARLDSFDGLHETTLKALLELLTEDIIHKDPWAGAVALAAPDGVAQTVAPRNPYPAHFQNMHDMIQANRVEHPTTAKIHALRFAGGEDKNPKTYSRPSSAEVSCTVVGEGPLPRHFISVYERTDCGHGTTHELSYLSEHVDPLTYPLVHVYGSLGYSNALRVGKSHAPGTDLSHVTMRQFYAHRLMQRYTHDSGTCQPS